MSYDVVVRNGTVIDGSGMAPYRADVGISNDRIAFIGRIAEAGRQEVDADGQVVTPGFIDVHTHLDAQLFWDSQGSCSSWHGVTTAVMGNCGFTLAPADVSQRRLVLRNLERAEDIPAVALEQGIDWKWSTFREFLEAVDDTPKAINYAANIGHSALRTWAMGERAFEGPASPEDLEVMRRELRDALEAGAIGFTSSRSAGHQTADNRPVASRLADWDEVRQLVSVIGELGGRGVFQLTPESVAHFGAPEARAEFFGRMRSLALDTGVPCTLGVPGIANGLDAIAKIEATAAAGGRMFGMAECRGVSTMLSFKTQLPFDQLDEWKPVRALPLEEQRAALQDPARRERLVRAATEGPYRNAVGAEAPPPKYELIRVVNSPVPPNPTVAELAAQRGVAPAEVMIDLALTSDFDQLFEQSLLPFDQETILHLMRHPRTIVGGSDAGAHVSQIVGWSFYSYLLAHWVRAEQGLTLEEAVRLITLAPARAWNIPGRGYLAEGWVADLNIFDPATVGPEMPYLEADLPGGARRFKQRARGFTATVVGGEITFRNGEHTGALPGQLVRGLSASR